MPIRASYGTWKSPITAESITSQSITLFDVVVDPYNSKVYHIEGRPAESGRCVLVDTVTGEDVVDKPANVRSGVHEYGGGASVADDGAIYYSNFGDSRVYRKQNDTAEPVTPDNKAHRYASFNVHPVHRHLLVSIFEDHTSDSPSTVVNTLCIINTKTCTVTQLVSGADFYAHPKFSPDGKHIVWQQWFHPDMPWEGSQIHVADVLVDSDVVTVSNDRHVAGENLKISATSPCWASNKTVVFTSDASGYQNPWKYTIGSSASPILRQPLSQDFSNPLWRLDWFSYAIVDNEGRFGLFSAVKAGRDVLYVINIEEGSIFPIDSPYVSIQFVRTLSTTNQEAVFRAAKVDEGDTIVKCSVNLSTNPPTCVFTTLRPYRDSLNLPSEFISIPRPVTLNVGGEEIHVIYHPPRNPDYSGSSIEGEKPPCVVSVHGGPTTVTGTELSGRTQFFTTRGWGWLSVNYGGSSGYGRNYINRLAGQFAIVDVEDTIKAARAISQPPYDLVDPSRLTLVGGSSGGLTVLAAISHSSDIRLFAACTSRYGISDLKMLGEETHKFESQYIIKLMGGREKDIPEVYKERSPVTHADKIVTPLLLLHGELDKVVPKEQTQLIYDTIRRRGGVVELKMYPEEGHGWRQEKNMKDALERELQFYERILGLNP